jgi:hypothetical protein
MVVLHHEGVGGLVRQDRREGVAQHVRADRSAHELGDFLSDHEEDRAPLQGLAGPSQRVAEARTNRYGRMR